ncbi:MAG: tRNA dihydrouridine(20/20a) synthase DusA [Woeseiaceae bacterium]|nr:tRNA dihydrouridine(20/20a) synthase DusA [Woeseiaceae bacterium]
MTDPRKSTTVAVAPMMDWTDRHCRYFLRLVSPYAELYTEMVTAAAIHHGDADRLLAFDDSEHPLVVQLGGSDPDLMTEAAIDAARRGYDEININVGCPSDRVQSGQFGACLMDRPELVAACLSDMQAAVDVPVTIKTRIGIDDQDNEAFLYRFVDRLAEAGCRRFIVHARIAILEGLSPKENRSVPPLNYERVFKLKRDYPELDVMLNGGLKTIADVDAVLSRVDGVMIGREAYHNPFFLAELDQHLGHCEDLPDRMTIVERMLPYIDSEITKGVRLGSITRHMLGLFAGQPGARAWRRFLSENAFKKDAGIDVVESALSAMRDASRAA